MASTLAAAVEFDGDLLVHVLAQVEDVLLLGALTLAAVSSSAAATTPVTASSVAAAAATASASVGWSLGHCSLGFRGVWDGEGGRVVVAVRTGIGRSVCVAVCRSVLGAVTWRGS